MTAGIAVALFGLFLTLFGGFAATMRSIGRLEQKFDIVWQWYCDETQKARDAGRRRTDALARRDAHDGGDPDGA